MSSSPPFAPEIQRQRLLVEGYYTIDVAKEQVLAYFSHITQALGLRTYGDPIVFSPGGEGKAENQGFDAFVPLIDSGICLYVWTQGRFFSTVLYTCKDFDADLAIETIKSFFKSSDFRHLNF